MSRRLLPNAAPKPKRKAKPAPRYSSIQRPSWERVCLELAKARAKRKPIRKVNEERRAKRVAKFKARLSRADWKKLRLEVFARDGFRCTAMHRVEGSYQIQCGYQDDTRTGKGLVCDHLRYTRFGKELLSDLRTLCRSCNARLTRELRANHSQGFRKSSSAKTVFGERAE